MESINIIFPNQLFENSVLINNGNKTFLIEEILFFKQFNFHKTKLYFCLLYTSPSPRDR